MNREEQERSETERHECTDCQVSFSLRSDFLNHLHTHEIENRYQCNICKENFNSLSDALKHAESHKEVKLYKCQECELTFLYPSLLVLHSYSHMQEKNFKCEICGKAYKYKSNLTQHLLVHNEPDRFRCLNCKKNFASMVSLRKHITRKICTPEREKADEACASESAERPFEVKTEKEPVNYLGYVTNPENLFTPDISKSVRADNGSEEVHGHGTFSEMETISSSRCSTQRKNSFDLSTISEVDSTYDQKNYSGEVTHLGPSFTSVNLATAKLSDSSSSPGTQSPISPETSQSSAETISAHGKKSESEALSDSENVSETDIVKGSRSSEVVADYEPSPFSLTNPNIEILENIILDL